tara:strand:+ start:3780 stop:3959 length:180 start_codon:yes stop_codon:yes gene_type:complete
MKLSIIVFVLALVAATFALKSDRIQSIKQNGKLRCVVAPGNELFTDTSGDLPATPNGYF